MAETKKVEVVISGIAGVFPESDNVEELKDLLFNKQNGVTLDSRRWPLGEMTVIIWFMMNSLLVRVYHCTISNNISYFGVFTVIFSRLTRTKIGWWLYDLRWWLLDNMYFFFINFVKILFRKKIWVVQHNNIANSLLLF